MGLNIASRATELLKLLESLRTSSEDIKDILIADHQGLTLVSTFDDVEKEARLSAMTAMVINNSVRALEEMEFGRLTNVVITGQQGYLFIRQIGPEVGIALSLKPGAAWSSLIPKINWVIMKILSIKEGDS